MNLLNDPQKGFKSIPNPSKSWIWFDSPNPEWYLVSTLVSPKKLFLFLHITWVKCASCAWWSVIGWIRHKRPKRASTTFEKVLHRYQQRSLTCQLHGRGSRSTSSRRAKTTARRSNRCRNVQNVCCRNSAEIKPLPAPMRFPGHQIKDTTPRGTTGALTR